MSLTVRELTGKTITVSLSAQHFVADLAQEVANATGNRPEQVQLVLKNEPLEDCRTLGSYSIEEGSELTAVAKIAAEGRPSAGKPKQP